MLLQRSSRPWPVTQNVLDNLGEATSNTIFVEEVTLLNEASTESEVEVLALMDLSTTVMSLSDVDSPLPMTLLLRAQTPWTAMILQ